MRSFKWPYTHTCITTGMLTRVQTMKHCCRMPLKRSGNLDSSGSYTCSSIFKFLTRSPLGSNILFKYFWKIKAPSDVKNFVWTAELNRINTNDFLQTRRPNKALSPNVCMTCLRSSETSSHLFLRCKMARH